MTNKYGHKKSVGGKQRLPDPLYTCPEQLIRRARMMLGLPIANLNRGHKKSPYGYEIDPEDSTVLRPIDQDFEILRKGLEYVKTCSYVETSAWMTRQGSRNISSNGLFMLLKDRRPAKESALPEEEREKLLIDMCTSYGRRTEEE